jgi:SAM-dependent methyltransferase
MVRKSSERNYPQVEFRLGFIEDLPIDDETVDLVISNCMINLSPDKEKVYQEIFRVLKPGGRLSISALVRLSDLPKEMMDDEGAYCGCLTGAASVSELKDILASTGFSQVSIQPECLTGNSQSSSIKLDLDTAPEDLVIPMIIRAVKPQ